MEENKVVAYEPQEIARDAQYESQVDIAKRYPRNLMKVVENSIAIATMDKETAETCNYALPRGGKKLNGASVHLARIVVQQYGNLRVESKVTSQDATQIHAEAVCFDLETNVAVKITSSKSIVGKNGRYKEDMIVVTGKAAAAIAYRNAVFSVVPKSIINKVYKASIQVITGDVSDETKLIKKRASYLKTFKDVYGVEEGELLGNLGINSIMQIKAEQLITLNGMAQSLKDGEFSVDEMFGRIPEGKIANPKINKPKNEK